MRNQRFGVLAFAFYLVFIGGAVYADLVFGLRVFHHALMTLLLCGWLFFKWRGNGLPHTPLNTPLYLAALAWLISAALSIDPRMALEQSWLLIVHLVLFFGLVDLFQQGRAKWLMEAQFIIAAMIVFISAVELASWYFGGALSGRAFGWADLRLIPLELPPRLAWALNSTNWLAAYVAPLILLTGAWAATMRRPDFRRVLWLLAGLLLGVLLFTFTRGGYLSFAAGLATFTALRLSQTENLRQRLSPAVMAGLGAVAVVIVFTALVIINVSQSRNSGDRVRIDLYESAVQMTADYPALGVGPGTFGRAYRSYRTPELARDRMSAAHNAYLGTAAEGGLITLALSLWVGLLLLRQWHTNWQAEPDRWRKIRLEAVMAALAGLAVHSMVDIFNRTPNVLMISLLAAYAITGHRSVLDEQPKGQRWPALVGLLILLLYGAWFVQIDRAQSHYINSLPAGTDALAEAQKAADMDSLTLYDLQVAYLEGRLVAEDAPEADLERAIAAYEQALALEPTWDTGWMNLSALYQRQGDRFEALHTADHAYNINPLTESSLLIARLYELYDTRDDATVIALYADAIKLMAQFHHLPLSDTWTATPLREQALEAYLAQETLGDDIRYRVLVAHGRLDEAAALLSEDPQSAASFWVAGEHALSVENDAESAEEYFSRAIALAPRSGDYYVARARATLTSDPDAARADLHTALLLGTKNEYANRWLAELESDPEQREELLKRALPGRSLDYAFTAVLYGGRISGFELLPDVRYPGPGREALTPWYTLATIYEDSGRTADAREVYEAIMEYAPDESEAAQRLQALTASS